MTSSLVGSEMCIRDRLKVPHYIRLQESFGKWSRWKLILPPHWGVQTWCGKLGGNPCKLVIDVQQQCPKPPSG
eukprot:5829626-Prorocentrum_lima.AAC.1